MSSPQGSSDGTDRCVVRVLAGSDVLTVVERLSGAASTEKAGMDSVLSSVGKWGAAGDFYAAAVLICAEQPSHLLIYSQRLLSDPSVLAAVVPDRWRVAPNSGVCTSYFTTLTRQAASTKARMQYLASGQAITIGTYDTSAQDYDERAISQRQLLGASIRSVSFHDSLRGATGLEVVAWDGLESLGLARHEGKPEFSSITGACYQVHAVFTRDLDSRAGRG